MMGRGLNFNALKTEATKDEWLTPPNVLAALGEFDLDPCAPAYERRPWVTAKTHIALPHDGLALPWHGRVWCNPPYGDQTFVWLQKLAKHGNGIALIFARTETKGFHREVWKRADALFFFEGRLRFFHVTGEPGGTANAPSVLIAYGAHNVTALEKASKQLRGHLVRLAASPFGLAADLMNDNQPAADERRAG